MDTDLIQQREHAHAFLDRLRGSMLSPLDRQLALAEVDDEPITASEAAAIDEAAASIRRNGGVPIEQVLADLDLTADDFERMAQTPAPDEPHR